MILGTHSRLRFSEPEDARFYRDLYVEGGPKAALLDVRREFGLPTLQEIRDLLKKSEAARAYLFTVEDVEGNLRGWCGLRGLNVEGAYCELFLVFNAQEDYTTPLARETLAVLLYRAFKQLGLRKVLATCLDSEPLLRACLLDHGFRSCGVQREAVFGGGAWHDLDTLSLDKDMYATYETGPGPGVTTS